MSGSRDRKKGEGTGVPSRSAKSKKKEKKKGIAGVHTTERRQEKKEEKERKEYLCFQGAIKLGKKKEHRLERDEKREKLDILEQAKRKKDCLKAPGCKEGKRKKAGRSEREEDFRHRQGTTPRAF